MRDANDTQKTPLVTIRIRNWYSKVLENGSGDLGGWIEVASIRPMEFSPEGFVITSPFALEGDNTLRIPTTDPAVVRRVKKNPLTTIANTLNIFFGHE